MTHAHIRRYTSAVHTSVRARTHHDSSARTPVHTSMHISMMLCIHVGVIHSMSMAHPDIHQYTSAVRRSVHTRTHQCAHQDTHQCASAFSCACMSVLFTACGMCTAHACIHHHYASAAHTHTHISTHRDTCGIGPHISTHTNAHKSSSAHTCALDLQRVHDARSYASVDISTLMSTHQHTTVHTSTRNSAHRVFPVHICALDSQHADDAC